MDLQGIPMGESLKFTANKSDISYLKTSQAFEHSNPLKNSLGSHSQLVGGSVDIMSSCSLLAFPLFRWPLLLGICLERVTVLDYS